METLQAYIDRTSISKEGFVAAFRLVTVRYFMVQYLKRINVMNWDSKLIKHHLPVGWKLKKIKQDRNDYIGLNSKF